MNDSPLALLVTLLCGTTLIGGGIGILVWGPSHAVSDAIALLLLVVALAGVWIVVTTAHAVVERVERSRDPERDVFRLS